MAANTKTSTSIANATSTPRVPNDQRVIGPSFLRSITDTVAKVAGDTDNSQFRFFRVHSSARIVSLKLGNTTLTSCTAVNVGLYDTSDNGSAAVSSALFASAQDIHTASSALDITYSVTTVDIAAKRIWELLALSSDPGKDYDMTAIATTAGSAAGTLLMHMTYVD